MDIRALLTQKEDNDSDVDMELSLTPRNNTSSSGEISVADQVKHVFEETLGVDSIGEVL